MATASANYSRAGSSGASQLWQLPLFFLSIGLFGYAAYLFIDPQPGLTLAQKVESAQALIASDRPEAALDRLNGLLQSEKMERADEGRIHLLISESLELAQKQKKISIPANHEQIVAQSRLALEMGVPATADIHRRMGESLEALGQVPEALDNYRQARVLDTDLSLSLRKRIIELQIEQNEDGAAEAGLAEYLNEPNLEDRERSWAMGRQSQLLIRRNAFADARSLLETALARETDAIAIGELNYWMGYAAWRMGEPDEAERYLRLARDQMQSRHPLDGDAAFALGSIYQDRQQPAEAIAFFQDVIVNYPGSKNALPSRLGRGVNRVLAGEDDAGLTDLHDLTNVLDQRNARQVQHIPDAVTGLRAAATALANRGNFQGALEVMGYEQQLQPEPPASFYARLGSIYERRAAQLESSAAEVKPADRIRRTQQIRELFTRAGDAYIAYSRALTVIDDKGYGDAMWKGVSLYDRAGELQRVISALELFIAERPADELAPDALLQLGRTFQAAGNYEKAIAAFQRNQFRYPKSLAASKSAVPLAQAYIAQGLDSYPKAEKVLISVVDNNPLITPEAEEFRQALFELGQMYYRTGRYEEAIARLQEWIDRYPRDTRLAELTFLMADSYRKSAVQLATRLGADAQPAADSMDIGEAESARADRLDRARRLYDKAIELYKKDGTPRELDQLYLRLSHFYRADCAYDLKQFEESIKLYDAAVFNYQDDPSALAAYVQIVNAYVALGRMDDARTANERAKWVLRRMPPGAFDAQAVEMPREHWEQWLKWTGESGMW